MIRMQTAYTSEIDDADAAVKEILEQLHSQGPFLKNAVGFLFCYIDFINAGTVEAVCKALPFDVVGCTTLGAAAPGAIGDIILTLTVLGSDEIEFRAGLSEPLTEEEEGRVVKVYRQTAAAMKTPPSLILVITPGLSNLAGDMVVRALDRESRGVPVFGTGALDADTKIRTPRTIYGGKGYQDRMPVLLFSGNFRPRFFVDSVWRHNIYSHKAVVTAAEGNRMISVNNIPAADYMKKIGLITEERLDLLFVFPLATDSDNSSLPNLFIIYTINKDGSLTCSANISEGAVVYIGSPGSGEVLNSARNITDALKKTRAEVSLIFSCFSRSIILTNPRDEMDAVQEELAHVSFPYVFIYAGGEICPVYDKKGAIVNQYHNYTIVSCSLETCLPEEKDRQAETAK